MGNVRQIGQVVRGLLVLGVAAVLALPLSTGPVAARQGGPGVAPAAKVTSSQRPVVFASKSQSGIIGSTYQICTVNPDGSNLTTLTPDNGATAALDPAWSPDGAAIAFSAGCLQAGRCLYTMKNDGTTLRQITFGLNHTDAQPAWAPDGLHLVFVSDRDGSQQLWTVSAVDGTIAQLTTVDGQQAPQHPSWSPDGANIVFSNSGNLYLIGSDGSKLRSFVISGKAVTPDWSPDGTRILYVIGQTVWIRSVDGTVASVVGTYLDALSPHWSANGNQIMLSAHDANGYRHLFMVDLLGDWVKQVTIGATDDITPDW